MMRESPLNQRVFDSLFYGLSLLALLDKPELREIAAGLRATETGLDEEGPLFMAVADAIERYAEVSE